MQTLIIIIIIIIIHTISISPYGRNLRGGEQNAQKQYKLVQ